MTPEKTGGRRKRAERIKELTDELLSEREAEILADTTIDWEKLRPKVTNNTTYDKLIAVVQKATAKNESTAQIMNRIKKLGNEAIVMARKVAKLVK